MDMKQVKGRIRPYIPSLILIFAVLASCDGDPADVAVYVEQASAPRITVESQEEFPQNNCGGGTLSQTLGNQATVQRSVTIGSKATTSAGAEVEIPAAIKLKLQEEIERTYQQTYGVENSRLDEIKMGANPGTEVIYIVTWEQHEYTSTVSYETGTKTYRTNYIYTLRVPKVTGSYPGTSCPTCYISGTVYNREDGQPIPDAAILYIASDGSGFGPVLAYSRFDGSFETTCPRLKHEHYPLRLTVTGLVPGCTADYQTDYLVHVDERKENIDIRVPLALIEEICARE